MVHSDLINSVKFKFILVFERLRGRHLPLGPASTLNGLERPQMTGLRGPSTGLAMRGGHIRRADADGLLSDWLDESDGYTQMHLRGWRVKERLQPGYYVVRRGTGSEKGR